MNELKLSTPLLVNGQKLETLTYDTNAITVAHFAEAEARKLKATTAKAGGLAGAAEMDYSMHLYLGMMAVVAINPKIDISDLERISGPDVMALMRIGRNFITSRSEEASEENSSDEPSATTPEPSTPQSEISKKSV